MGAVVSLRLCGDEAPLVSPGLAGSWTNPLLTPLGAGCTHPPPLGRDQAQPTATWETEGKAGGGKVWDLKDGPGCPGRARGPSPTAGGRQTGLRKVALELGSGSRQAEGEGEVNEA